MVAEGPSAGPEVSRGLGIVAGSGDLPRRVAEAARAGGRDVFVIALQGHADPAMIDGFPHAWVALGQPAVAMDRLREQGISDILLAGAVGRPTLADLRPDWRSAGLLARLGGRAFSAGDDGLLKAVIGLLEHEGFAVGDPRDWIGAADVATLGIMGSTVPDEQAWADIARARAVALALGAVDVGQGAVVQNGLVLAVEAIEGTEAMLERCRTLRREGSGGVLVKLAKPGQEERADLPTIGARTVEQAAAAGLRGIAVEAGRAFVLDRPGVVAAADAAGLFLVGIDPVGMETPREDP